PAGSRFVAASSAGTPLATASAAPTTPAVRLANPNADHRSRSPRAASSSTPAASRNAIGKCTKAGWSGGSGIDASSEFAALQESQREALVVYAGVVLDF